ncbi:MAG TPA: alpha/beta hydrolase [Caulobacteraceae bacterium]|nr:alpha/beta hydrolase [Caulobacteraceae bacterium]
MPLVRANGIDVEYESFGPDDAEPMLLVMGLGYQLTRWPEAFVRLLVERGNLRVIRFDNRDVGLSSKMDHAGPLNAAQLFGERMQGRPIAPPYTLDDMARDAVGLLDALKIDRAHVVGASMGGMIAQLIAADHPARVKSLTSIMSTTGNPLVGQPTPEAFMALATPAPPPSDEAAFVAHALRVARVISGPGYPLDEQAWTERVLADAKRSYHPPGFVRQLAAIWAAPDRTEKLRTITAPTVVIHGELDPLVQPDGGRATAAAVPGAEMVSLPRMGHSLPVELYDELAAAILRAVERGRSA